MKNIFQTIIEQSPISIVITDLKGNITYVNPKFVELTGYKPEEVMGQTPRILKPETVTKEEYENIWKTILSGNVWKGELVNKKKNGDLYNEFAVISPIKDNEGNIIQLIGLKEDITDLKIAQDELHKAEKFKGLAKMASYISHEIKSPLTSIKMNLDMLIRKNDLPGYACKSLLVIQSEITRLFNLTKNILEYSKQEEIKFSHIYLPQFFNSIYDIFTPQLEEKRIKFINKVEGCRILGDIQKLESAFILLIENSLAAVSENGTIEISSVSNNGNCSLFLKDNGCGIENKGQIFFPFYTTKKYGTGLGLVIAKDIIERHKGEIKLVSSKPGETIFEIILKTCA